MQRDRNQIISELTQRNRRKPPFSEEHADLSGLHLRLVTFLDTTSYN